MIAISTTVRRLVLVSALALGASAWAVSEEQFQPALEVFLQATHGNEAAIDKAADTFAALAAQEPANPMLLAYAGSATALKATSTMLPWKKMRYAEDGMAMLDKALSMLTAENSATVQHGVPTALAVRFSAANTFLAVPGFMNRGARGSKLLAEVIGSPLFPNASLLYRGEVWMKAADVAAKDRRVDEARRFYNEVLTAGAPQKEAARTKLQALGS